MQKNMMDIWIAGTMAEVKMAADSGLVSAVVTNPTVMAQWTAEGRKLEEVCREVVDATGLPLYVQLYGPTTTAFLAETEYLRKISPLIRPKLPSTLEGISAAKQLEAGSCKTLVTTVVSVNQAYACAAAGVSAICPYLNRLQQSGEDALIVINRIAAMYRRELVPTRILPASVRTEEDIHHALVSGCSGVIVFYPLFLSMFRHAVTADSLAAFETDWKKIPYAFRDDQHA